MFWYMDRRMVAFVNIATFLLLSVTIHFTYLFAIHSKVIAQLGHEGEWVKAT